MVMEPLPIARMLNWGRFVGDGIPIDDVRRASELAGPSEWLSFWTRRGDLYEERAEQALEEGHRLSAGEWLWLASMSYHYGQYMWYHEPARKENAQRRKQDLYNRAAPHLLPPAERVEVMFEEKPIPGFLRLPPGNAPPAGWPCVLLLGGLESTKEESYAFESLGLERGLATFAFDGPGQGEFHFQVSIQPDFERYATAVVDQLVARPELCADRLGVLGRSLGGHYAIRCAAHDHRLRACVSWGGSWSEEPWDELPESELRGWLYAAGMTDDPDGALDYLRSSLDLADIADKLRAPTLAVLGGSQLGRNEGGDWIDAGMEYNLDRHIDDFPPDTIELVIVPGGDHCCHNRGQLVRPQMADWLVDQLGGD